MNYLGYMWAEHGEKLDQARELIEKAVKAEPKNAAYLDSLAWVLFKQNQPQEALPYALKAAELSEKPDATVFDHIGDIYAALKQPEKAREAWRKSLSLEPNEEVRKKLEVRAAPNEAGETVRRTKPERNMAYQFQKHYTRDEARALLPAAPAVAEAHRSTARRLGEARGAAARVDGPGLRPGRRDRKQLGQNPRRPGRAYCWNSSGVKSR